MGIKKMYSKGAHFLSKFLPELFAESLYKEYAVFDTCDLLFSVYTAETGFLV
jgi:hypothetical protein